MSHSDRSLSLPGEALALSIINLLGTPQLIVDYEQLLLMLRFWARQSAPTAVEFCNTQIVAKRRIEPEFHDVTAGYDYFVPDGMPLIWALRTMGVNIRDRVYGPTFLRHAIMNERVLRHYLFGGSEITSQRLVSRAAELSDGKFQVVGANHRFWNPEDSPAIIDEINELSPDVIWVGLGTPKQQQWICENKHLIRRGVLLTVGFAFDVNAGTKRDAPVWMQRLALTWLFRVSQEPSRLLGRYLKYNSWFVWFCIKDAAMYLLKRSSGTASRQA